MKEFTCIVCPNGCSLKINEKTLEVTGNICKRGVDFAKTELTKPMRTICTTVRTKFDSCPVVPVRVSKEIPKNMIFKVMNEINKIVLDKKLGRDDVVIKNVLNTGADVIITSNKLKGE